MSFIKQSLLLVVLSALLSACGGMAKKEDADIGVDADADSEMPLVKIPRPEPANKPSAPRAAKDEFAGVKVAMDAQNWPDAESRLLLMIQTYPQLTGLYTNLGIVYTKQEKLEDAEQAYRSAIAGNAFNFDAYTNLGLLLREQGRFSDAETVYLSALTQWPHHQPSLINLGILNDMYMGKFPEALGYFKTAQRLNDEPDKKLKGWIVDLERRIGAQQ